MCASWDGLGLSEVGKGPAVLWLHGYTLRSSVWEPLWAHLPGWRHIGLDLPWHGKSRDLRAGEDLQALADAVAANAVAASVAHVVGMSFGTVLATEMAVRHPDAFLTWTLAAPSLVGMPHEYAVQQRYRDLAALYAAAGPGSHMTELWMSVPPAIFAGVNARAETREWIRGIVDRHEWRELKSAGMRQLVTRDQQPAELATVTAPVHVVVGERDLLTHRACARSIAAAVHTAVVHQMPGCGHLPLLEEPASSAILLAHNFQLDVRR
jgi:pimeloyl-ACP methyl ester carboxylesterase